MVTVHIVLIRHFELTAGEVVKKLYYPLSIPRWENTTATG